jgi:murein L,D-transpeptidase YcbB/YkuD
MNVIVGRAYKHKTPIFAAELKYIVFRPYWNVPIEIQRKELVPLIQKDLRYITHNDFEVTKRDGHSIKSGEAGDGLLQELRTGAVAIRQKPGAKNSLGLVKLLFPNAHDVYLHGTPSMHLFARPRRDFSHGCIRVEHPAELVAWALQDEPGWSLDRVREAMEHGKDNVQVPLKTPIPVLILYGTALVEPNGEVHFFRDIYGHDRVLEKALRAARP